MKKILLNIVACYGIAISSFAQDNDQGFKTTVDMKVNDVGSIVCEYSTKYNASNWDVFMKTIGNNTNIIKNQLIRTFPKYQLSEFNYSQDANERTNKIKFKIDGMIYINKDGKWQGDLDTKNPDVTSISKREFLFIEQGTTMRIHLPEGVSDGSVGKDSFGKAILTYSAQEKGKSGWIFRIAGILLALAGGWMLFKNRGSGAGSVKANPIPSYTEPYRQPEQVNPPPPNKELGNS